MRSWLKLNLWTYTERRGTVGTIEARIAASEIMPFSLPSRSEVTATTGEVRFRSSWYVCSGGSIVLKIHEPDVVAPRPLPRPRHSRAPLPRARNGPRRRLGGRRLGRALGSAARHRPRSRLDARRGACGSRNSDGRTGGRSDGRKAGGEIRVAVRNCRVTPGTRHH